jgi:hypothetical protein
VSGALNALVAFLVSCNSHLYQQVWNVAMLGSMAFALAKGGRPERLVGVMMVAASLASAAVQRHYDWNDPQWYVMFVDVLFLAFLLWLTLTTDRPWLLFASAFQLLGVITHLAIMADRTVGGRAYVVAGAIWSYLILIAMDAGTFALWRREAATAPYAERPA